MALPFIILLVLAAVAPTVQATGVNVFGVDEQNYTRRIDAAEHATFEWVVFNNDTSPFLLKVNVTNLDTNSIHPTFEQNFTAINPGSAHSTTYPGPGPRSGHHRCRIPGHLHLHPDE